MIRKMKRADLDKVMEIEEVTFSNGWNKEQFLYELKENEFASLFVIEEAGIIVGYIDFWITFDSATLANIAILSKFRKCGYASKLLRHMIQECETAMCENITLEVRAHNISAITLYQAFGFIEINIKKQYYNDNGEDAIYMMKALGGNLR